TEGLAAFHTHWFGVASYAFTLATVVIAAILSRLNGVPLLWRRFPLSPSEGERAGVRGPLFRRQLTIAFCCALPIALISATGMFAHFRVLGRHFAPILPIVILTLASGL